MSPQHISYHPSFYERDSGVQVGTGQAVSTRGRDGGVGWALQGCGVPGAADSGEGSLEEAGPHQPGQRACSEQQEGRWEACTQVPRGLCWGIESWLITP